MSGPASASLGYDAGGNRNNGGQSIGIDNQLLSSGSWTNTYDKEGNLTHSFNDALISVHNAYTSTGSYYDISTYWDYTYDNQNHMLTAVESERVSDILHGTVAFSSAIAQATYAYGPFGERLTSYSSAPAVNLTQTTIGNFYSLGIHDV